MLPSVFLIFLKTHALDGCPEARLNLELSPDSESAIPIFGIHILRTKVQSQNFGSFSYMTAAVQ